MNSIRHFPVSLFLFIMYTAGAQTNSDSWGKINNLVLPTGYLVSEYAAIPAYTKSGSGTRDLILIPGLGFDASIFDDFVKENRNHFTIYTITIPGFGNTKAPAMPVSDSSYGLQYWNRGVEAGIVKLIKEEKLHRPLIAGYFVQGTQLALRLGIDYPDLVSGVVVMGGPAKFILIQQGVQKEYPFKSSIDYIDRVTAPQWFRNISKEDFDKGNYLPEIYSLDKKEGKALWDQVSSVPLPVMIRYLLEFFASDITVELDKIQSPVLVLRPTFNSAVLDNPVNNYVSPQFINIWDRAAKMNRLILVKDIPGSATCVWKDNPLQTNLAISDFIKTLH
jgi:pimeloyl-ACP methyl ester carboxylesterase